VNPLLGVSAVLLLLLLVSNRTSAAASRVSYLNVSYLPRGMRNNNPGNIVKTSSMWPGEIPSSDSTFKQFSSYVWGIRAMIDLLNRYMTTGCPGSGAAACGYSGPLTTLKSISCCWAPAAGGNNPDVYADYISSFTGLGKNAQLTWSKQTAELIVRAMAAFENGVQDAVTKEQFNAAWALL